MSLAVAYKAIRKKTGLSQSRFADKFGLGLRQIQQWEAGRRHPVGPLVHFLKLIDHQPEIVAKVVAEDKQIVDLSITYGGFCDQ